MPVIFLHFLLCAFDALGDHAVLDHFPFFLYPIRSIRLAIRSDQTCASGRLPAKQRNWMFRGRPGGRHVRATGGQHGGFHAFPYPGWPIRPPSRTPGPSLISVPRPAMLVAMVTAPAIPASATTWASRECCLALSTLCGIFFCLSMRLSSSLTSTDVVPTSTGLPAAQEQFDLFYDRLIYFHASS